MYRVWFAAVLAACGCSSTVKSVGSDGGGAKGTAEVACDVAAGHCAAGEACCFVPSGNDDSCIAPTDACESTQTFTSLMTCDDAADCAGQPGTVCCLGGVTPGRFGDARCTAEALCKDSNQLRLCDPLASDPGCPTGSMCNVDVLEIGLYAACGQP